MKILSLVIATLLTSSATLIAQDNNNTEDIEISAAGPLGELAGSYKDAGTDTPVILIIPGSGPTDRNGNSPLGVNANSYKLLAGALAQKGISSVRIDKRGMFGSAAAIKDANAVTIGSYADDVHEWAKVMTAKTGQKCIWVAGHSEGGLVALFAAQKSENICGIITIAAPGRPLDTVLREQLKANPANAPILGDALGALNKLKSGERVDVSAMHPALQSLFNPAVQPFMIDLFSHDPANLAAQTKVPLLVIQGDNDIQVAVKDAITLTERNANAQLTIIKDMNHILKNIDSKNRSINAASYANPNLPISSELVDTIAKFIKK